VRRFRDRREAGHLLAERLEHHRGEPGLLVLALPRGGVPVASEVATALAAPLDVFIVRKLGAPGHGELALGAIASGGVRVVNERVVRSLGLDQEIVAAAAEEEEQELLRQERLYRGDRGPVEVESRTAIVVDDGLATGATMLAAVVALTARKPRFLVAAVPVAAPEACEELAGEVDEIVCASTPQPFYAVGLWYEDFDQTRDAQVRELLERADRGGRRAA